METFVVERSLKGIPMDQLAAAQGRAIATASRMCAEGTQVRYLRSTFVPDTGQCMCLFEAENAGDVEALNRSAGIPFNRVAKAMDLQSPR